MPFEGRSVAALLPMKAHSARIESKNFREIAGKPLYRWLLDTLLSMPEIDVVVINTDAREKLKDTGLVGDGAGGKVRIRDRKPEICGDSVSMNLVLADDLAASSYDIYFMTHTTNPLLSAVTIRKMLKRYMEAVATGDADSLFTVTRHQVRFYTTEGTPINHDPGILLRTQDLPPYLEENSVGYVFSSESFARTGARIGRRPVMFETPAVESVDIDEPSDWYIAETLLQRVAAGSTPPRSEETS